MDQSAHNKIVSFIWSIADDKTQIGYEISFNKYFYTHKPLRSLEAVTADILKLEQETEGLLKKPVSFKGWDQ